MDADVGVIGLGTMGSMALWQLARKGISVIGFEQFGIGHDMSAAGGESRLFRTIYKEGPEYVPLLRQSYNLWKELEEETGNQLLQITGGLIIGDMKLKSMQNALESIQTYNLEHEILQGKEIKNKFPQHNLLPGESIIVDKMAGYLHPQYAIISAVERAKELGATVQPFSKVNDIKPITDGVNILTRDKTYKVKKLLVTTGPWSKSFLEEFKSYLEVRRLINTWFLPKRKVDFLEHNFLPFTREKENVSYYGFPSIDRNMVKIGIFSTEKEKIEGPNYCDKNVETKELIQFTKLIKSDLPELYHYPSRVGAYMDVYTKDKHPIIGRMPTNKNIYLITGFSGHGFKMAPAIGKIASEIIFESKVNYSINKFTPSRF